MMTRWRFLLLALLLAVPAHAADPLTCVTLGTTSFRMAATCSGSEVSFVGIIVSAADGTQLMIWDGGLNNMRAMTAGEIAAIPGQITVALRAAASTQIATGTDADAKLKRAIVDVLKDELNLHALKINAILDAVDAATSLADLKTRITAIPDYPQRTLSQIKTAIETKLTSGTVD